MTSSVLTLGLSTALFTGVCACGRDARVAEQRPAVEHTTEGAPGASAGMTREAHDLNPPGPPGSVAIEVRAGCNVVTWSGTRDDTILGYVIYRRCAGEAWVEAQRVALRADDSRNRGQYTFEDRRDTPCEYAVAALDARGHPGPSSAEVH